MTNVSSYEPGSFCWLELATNDVAASREFYGSLFGWTVEEHPMGEMGTYYIFQKKGRDCAAMYQIGPQMEGMRPNWTTYISVANVDESTDKARSLGAQIYNGPFDVGENGRMTVLADPQGAMFCMWQAKKNNGIEIRNEADTLCWNELQARQLDVAKNFYTALFGWNAKESPEYVEWHLGEQAIGGMMRSQWPEGVPSYWLPYIAVNDCDATFDKAKAAGARPLVEPMDIPKVGRFAVVMDPQGAPFALIRLSM